MSEARPGTLPSTAHKCPGPGPCTRDVPWSMLMCSGHWSLVPSAIKRKVYRAWDGGAGAGSARHTAAMAEAIAAVNGEL